VRSFVGYRSSKAGMPPGSVVFTGLRKVEGYEDYLLVVLRMLSLDDDDFLVGVYGTNFENIPELRWRWGYPLLWLLMLTVAGSMLTYFRRRRWR
jgi:Mg2+ and Co2+ transporter CorA